MLRDKGRRVPEGQRLTERGGSCKTVLEGVLRWRRLQGATLHCLLGLLAHTHVQFNLPCMLHAPVSSPLAKTPPLAPLPCRRLGVPAAGGCPAF